MIEVKLDREEIPAGTPVRGTLLLQPESELELDSVTLEAKWYTSGTGDPNENTVVRRSLSPGTIEQGSSFESSFEMEIPKLAPVSYQGDLINVNWEIRVECDTPLGSDFEELKRTAFVVLPPWEQRD
ncbi:MAG: hypothetical protein ABEJ65_05200 [bacterium]